MSTPVPYSPVCPCSYDLAGLDGPPWTCPECAHVTAVWPPPNSVVEVTRLEQWALALWLTGLCTGSIALPWVSGRDAHQILLLLYISTGIGTFVWSSLFCREARRHGLFIWLLYRVFWSICVLIMSLMLGLGFALVSSILQRLLDRS